MPFKSITGVLKPTIMVNAVNLIESPSIVADNCAFKMISACTTGPYAVLPLALSSQSCHVRFVSAHCLCLFIEMNRRSGARTILSLSTHQHDVCLRSNQIRKTRVLLPFLYHSNHRAMMAISCFFCAFLFICFVSFLLSPFLAANT